MKNKKRFLVLIMVIVHLTSFMIYGNNVEEENYWDPNNPNMDQLIDDAISGITKVDEFGNTIPITVEDIDYDIFIQTGIVVQNNSSDEIADNRTDEDGDLEILGKDFNGNAIINPYFNSDTADTDTNDTFNDKNFLTTDLEMDDIQSHPTIGDYIVNPPQMTPEQIQANGILMKSIADGLMAQWGNSGNLTSEFIAAYNAAMDAYKASIENGGTPNFEGFKNLTFYDTDTGGAAEQVSISKFVIISAMPSDISDGSAVFVFKSPSGALFYYTIPLADFTQTQKQEAEKEEDYEEPVDNEVIEIGTPKAEIQAMGVFDVEQAIPTNEDLYTRVVAPEYQMELEMTKYSGKKKYNILVMQTVTYNWNTIVNDTDGENGVDDDMDGTIDELDGSERRSVIVPLTETKNYAQTVEVIRPYEFYGISLFGLYELERAELKNYALPGRMNTLSPLGYIAPTAESFSEPFERHFRIREVIDLGSSLVNSEPPASDPDLSSHAISEPLIVHNDKLVLKGEVILDDSAYEYIAPPPMKTVFEIYMTPEDMMYQEALTISGGLPNKADNESECIVYYHLLEDSQVNIIERMIERKDITPNPTTVHTPVVCNGSILSLVDYNQEVEPDHSRAALVLGKATTINLRTSGEHLDIPGYGNRDYKDYTSVKQVRLPFDCYVNTDRRDPSKYLPANSWYNMDLDASVITIYVPIWVEEGDYEIDYQAIAINNGTSGKEEHANLNVNNYIAIDSSEVRVVGRLYGFKVTDISDYDRWHKVFRVDDSVAHSSRYYYSGNQNKDKELLPIMQQYTLPIMGGSHPLYKNLGPLKTGYHFKFNLETIGQYYNHRDGIAIYPRFYYMAKDGSLRQEVDLYYHEFFNEQDNYFVKVDEQYNRHNAKYIQLGNPYRNVPEVEIADTSRILGVDQETMRDNAAKLGYLDFIVLSRPLRTYIGDTSNIPMTVSEDLVKSCAQKWYGEYYLPNDLFIAPKGFDVIDFGRTHNGLDGKEAFWLKDGYIIVNFDIQTFKNAGFLTPSLSYQYAPNANMWDIEGYNQLKTDHEGNVFSLEYGDIVFYYSDEKASDDYGSQEVH